MRRRPPANADQLRDFGNALRDVLGLEPLYVDDRWIKARADWRKHQLQRFYPVYGEPQEWRTALRFETRA